MMTSKEALEQIMKIYGETNSLEGTYDLFLKIKQDLERLEVLETSVLEYKDQEKLYWQTNENNVKLRQENEKLKSIIKENFAYYPDALFDKICFKWTGPVMEDEIKEVLNKC